MSSGWGPLFTNMTLIVYTADPELCAGQIAAEAAGVRKPGLPSSCEGCGVLTRVHLAPPASSYGSPFPPTNHSLQSHFFLHLPRTRALPQLRVHGPSLSSIPTPASPSTHSSSRVRRLSAGHWGTKAEP